MPTLVVQEPVSRIGGDSHPERRDGDGSKPREDGAPGGRWSTRDKRGFTLSFGPGTHTVSDDIAEAARADALPWVLVLDDDLDDYAFDN